MISLAQVKRVKEKYEEALMRKKGVMGCGVGYKNIAGQKTEEICIVCYVVKKLPEDQLAKAEIIPTLIEDIPTDVVESGEIRVL